MSHEPADWIEQLATRYGRLVFACAWRVLGDADDAQDVQQEVFVKLLNGKVRPEAVQDWPAYLKVMASRCAVDQIRRRTRQIFRGAESLDMVELPSTGRDPAQIAAARQQTQRLRKALATFPERDALIFQLRFFEDFTYEAIAAQLDLTANQVGVILHRLRLRLRALLEPCLNSAPSKEADHVRTATR